MYFDKEKQVFCLTKEELEAIVNNANFATEILGDVYTFRDNIMKVCAAFKITTKDGKRIRQTIIDKTENPIMSLCSGGIETLGLMTSASIGIKSAEREIEKRFGFLAAIGPLLAKYGGAGEKLLEARGIQKTIPAPSTHEPKKISSNDEPIQDAEIIE